MHCDSVSLEQPKLLLLLSTRSHPDIEVTVVASRNEQKARAYAKILLSSRAKNSISKDD